MKEDGAPVFAEDVMTCPTCGANDNVALVQDTAKLIWCSCGQIFKWQQRIEDINDITEVLGYF